MQLLQREERSDCDDLTMGTKARCFLYTIKMQLKLTNTNWLSRCGNHITGQIIKFPQL